MGEWGGLQSCRTEPLPCGIWCHLQVDSVQAEWNRKAPSWCQRIAWWCGNSSHPPQTHTHWNWVTRSVPGLKCTGLRADGLQYVSFCLLPPWFTANPSSKSSYPWPIPRASQTPEMAEQTLQVHAAPQALCELICFLQMPVTRKSTALLFKMWSRDHSFSIIWELVGTAEPQAPAKTCWIRTCTLERFSGDSCT